MAVLSYEGIGITAMVAVVPRHIIHNYEYTEYFPADQVKKVVDKVGVIKRRFADSETQILSSLLCLSLQSL